MKTKKFFFPALKISFDVFIGHLFLNVVSQSPVAHIVIGVLQNKTADMYPQTTHERVSLSVSVSVSVAMVFVCLLICPSVLLVNDYCL